MTDTEPLRCGCCGQISGALDIDAAIVAANLTPLMGKVLRAIAAGRGEWITAERIAAKIYAEDIDGGPLWAVNAVSVHIHNMRKRLAGKRCNFAIEGRLGNGYRIVAAAESNIS